MNRRSFFRAAALGGAVTPSALSVVSTPPGLAPFVLGGRVVVNQTIRALGVIADAGALIGSKVAAPWWFKGAHVTVTGSRILIERCEFAVEPAPFWSRLLRLAPVFLFLAFSAREALDPHPPPPPPEPACQLIVTTRGSIVICR